MRESARLNQLLCMLTHRETEAHARGAGAQQTSVLDERLTEY